MFEHIETKVVVLSIFCVVLLLFAVMLVLGKSMHEKKPTKVHYFLFVLMIPAAIMPFMDSYYTTKYINNNTKMFNDGVTMKCYGGFTPYLVSKENGWTISGESFTKDDFIADRTRCFLPEQNQ
jgi:hypothetical protein